MRTTIELKPERRVKLLELAARKGDKGFSSVIADAIESYLKNRNGAGQVRTKALSVRGKFKKKDAELLRHRVTGIRGFWRRLSRIRTC